jgi:membrane-associated phospholipid phosphatase
MTSFCDSHPTLPIFRRKIKIKRLTCSSLSLMIIVLVMEWIPAIVSSNIESVVERILRVDEALSIPVFRLSLPLPLEFLLSIPGNLMGPPLIQVLVPFGIFWLSNKDTEPWIGATDRGDQEAMGDFLVLSLLLVVLQVWIFFLSGNLWILSRILYPNASFAVSPIIGTGVAHYFGAAKPNAQALVYHAIILYNLSCVVIMFLKHGTRRKRPCCTFPQWIPLKHFQIIPKILQRHSATTSFPSGDAMAGTCWAIPLWYLGYTRVAVLLVALTALGRIFFLAHHLLDTIVGIGVCLVFHAILGLGVSGLPAVGTAEWYHPIMAFMVLLVASRFRKGDEK